MRGAPLLICLLLGLPAALYSQVLQPYGPVAGTGLAGTVYSPGVWAAYGNPAALGVDSLPSVAFGYQQVYGLPELGTPALAASLPLPNGQALGLGMSTIGFESYRETNFGLGYALVLYDKLRVGVRTNVLHIQVPGFESEAAFMVDAGAQLLVSERLELGVLVVNSSQTRIGSERPLPLASRLSIGANYRASPQLQLLLELQQQSEQELGMGMGLVYQPVEALSVQLGVLSNPGQVAAGVAYQAPRFVAGISTSWQAELGFSPQVYVQVPLRKNSKRQGDAE